MASRRTNPVKQAARIERLGRASLAAALMLLCVTLRIALAIFILCAGLLVAIILVMLRSEKTASGHTCQRPAHLAHRSLA